MQQTRFLHNHYDAGDYPQWDLYIQTMDPAQEDALDFDPLDSTKIWPEVGGMIVR